MFKEIQRLDHAFAEKLLAPHPDAGWWKKSKIFHLVYIKACTLPETNKAPKEIASQKERSLPTIHFQVRTVSLREGKSTSEIGIG